MTVRPWQRLFHSVLESHDGRALVPIPKRSTSPWETSTPRRGVVGKRLPSIGRLEKRTCSGNRENDTNDPKRSSLRLDVRRPDHRRAVSPLRFVTSRSSVPSMYLSDAASLSGL